MQKMSTEDAGSESDLGAGIAFLQQDVVGRPFQRIFRDSSCLIGTENNTDGPVAVGIVDPPAIVRGDRFRAEKAMLGSSALGYLSLWLSSSFHESKGHLRGQ